MKGLVLALLLLVPALAHAQDATERGILDKPSETMMIASTLSSVAVEAPDGSAIGDVEDVVLSRDGRIVALVVGVGGWLGLGERKVAISYDRFEVKDTNEGIRLVCDIDRLVLDGAPTFQRRGQ